MGSQRQSSRGGSLSSPLSPVLAPPDHLQLYIMPPPLPYEIVHKIIKGSISDPPTERWRGSTAVTRSAADLELLLCCSRVNSCWRAVAEELLFLYVYLDTSTLSSFHKAVQRSCRPHYAPVRTKTLLLFRLKFNNKTWKTVESILQALPTGDGMLKLVFYKCLDAKVHRLLTLPGTIISIILMRVYTWEVDHSCHPLGQNNLTLEVIGGRVSKVSSLMPVLNLDSDGMPLPKDCIPTESLLDNSRLQALTIDHQTIEVSLAFEKALMTFRLMVACALSSFTCCTYLTYITASRSGEFDAFPRKVGILLALCTSGILIQYYGFYLGATANPYSVCRLRRYLDRKFS